VKKHLFGILFFLAITSAVQAIPSWIGVYGSYQRHNGQNPGIFTVLMNQDYAGLKAEVGIKIGSGPWTVYQMTKTGIVSVNSIWSFTPTAAFPVNTPVQYYFHGYDTAGGHCWDSKNGQNYSYTAADSYVAPTWMGVYGSFQRHNGLNPGQFTVLVNREFRTGLNAGVGFRINGQAWQFQTMGFVSNYQGNSVWRWTPPSAFSTPANVEYYFHSWDDRDTKLWDVAGGANYRIAFTNNPPTWMGVYGSFTRHSGENPGTFTVLVNREKYQGLEAGMGYSLNDGITWSFTNMTWQRNHEGNSVFEWTPANPFTGKKVRYYFHAWDSGGASLWDVNNNNDYVADLFATPSNISTELFFEYNNNPTSIPIRAMVWIQSGLYDGLRAGMVYRLGGDWKIEHFDDVEMYGDWIEFNGSFSPGVEGTCRQELEYYGFVADNDGFYITDGNQLEPKIVAIQKTMSGWPGFMVYSNRYLGTTSQQSRSVGYFKNSQVQAIRHKLLPDANYGPWITMNEHHYFEVPNKIGRYTSVVEALSIFGCTTTSTNIMALVSTNTAFVPVTNLAARLRAHLLSFMPANPVNADKYLFSSYVNGGNAVWSQNWTTNFDFSGIAWDRFQCGTLVSPRHMICAAHFPRFVGDKVTFHDKFGTPHQRTIVAEVTEGFTSTAVVGDCHIYLLDQPLPNTVKWYKFLPPTYRYQDTLVGAPVIMTDQEKKALVTKVQSVSFGLSYVKDDTLSPIFHENLVSGDSGHPVFVVVNGELVLASLHTVGGTGGSGTFYSHPSQFSGFVHLFNRFANGYSISLFDMTGWGTYLP